MGEAKRRSFWQVMCGSWGLYTDFYELTMMQGYYFRGVHRMPAVFEYYVRAMPFGGGWIVFAGLELLLDFIEGWRFTLEDLDYLSGTGRFKKEFLSFLESWRPRVTIWSPPEGTVVFPGEPIVRVEGALADLQLLESALLNILNFSSLIATKASRVWHSAGLGRVLVDFGMRRAQGPAILMAARSAYIGGVDATSCVQAGELFGIPVTGTMAHSWVQSFDSEEEAFLTFARLYPQNPVFLVDTYHTLESGVPSAVRAYHRLKEEGIQVWGIRIDSGDLRTLIPAVRQYLDAHGARELKIFVSGNVDEYVVEELRDLPIDGYGVGTRLVTAYDHPALDGVYKLVELGGTPRFKISDDPEKVLLPFGKDVYRLWGEGERWSGDVVVRRGSGIPACGVALDGLNRVWAGQPVDCEALPSYRRAVPLFRKVMEEGKKVYGESIEEMRRRAMRQIGRLPEELRGLRVASSRYRKRIFYSPELVDAFRRVAFRGSEGSGDG